MSDDLTMLALFQGLAAHLDPLVFLFLLGLTGLFRLLASKSPKTEQTDEADEPSPLPRVRPDLPQRQSPDSDEERIRRFLEALGQPPSSQPPPPVTPRPIAPAAQPVSDERARTVRPRRNILNPLPPLTSQPPPPPGSVQRPRQVTQPVYEAKAVLAPPPEAPVYEVQDSAPVSMVAEPAPMKTPADAYAIAGGPAAAAQSGSSLSVELRTAGALRRAILLREILGPPRSLAPLEQ